MKNIIGKYICVRTLTLNNKIFYNINDIIDIYDYDFDYVYVKQSSNIIRISHRFILNNFKSLTDIRKEKFKYLLK